MTIYQHVPNALAWEMTGELLFALQEDTRCPGELQAMIISKPSPSCSNGVWHSSLCRHRPQLLPLSFASLSPRAKGPLASPCAGTPFENTQCRACPRGFFSSSDSSTKPCQPHQDCEQQGKVTNVQGNQYHDTLCTSCRLGRSNSTQGPGELPWLCGLGGDAGTTRLPG